MRRNFLAFGGNMPLRFMFILFLSFIITITVLIAGTIALNIFSRVLIDKSLATYMDYSNQITNNVNHAMQKYYINIETLIDNSAIQNILNSEEPITENDKQVYSDIVKNLFGTNHSDYLYLSSVDIYMKSNEVLHYGEFHYYIDDIFNSIYYQKAISIPTALYLLGYNHNNDKIEALRTIYDDEYIVKGLIILSFDSRYFQRTFMSYNLNALEDIYLVNENCVVQCARDPMMVGTQLSQKYISRLIMRSGYFEEGKNIVLYHTLKNTYPSSAWLFKGWRILVFADREKFFGEIDYIKSSIAKYLVLCILFGAAISIAASSIINKPIRNLVQAMKNVQTGNFDITVSYSRVDSYEIAFLIKSFNYMLQEIKSLINNVYVERLMNKEMELKTLQNQMNPHFLFNTLQMISWKAREYNAENVCEMIENLSFLLSQNFRKNNNRFIPVKEELDYISNYIALVKMKFGEKISFNININKNIHGCLVPRFLLQPLIENSINHGIAKKFGKGTVNIVGKNVDTTLEFIVEDDGIGISREKLEELVSELEIKAAHITDEDMNHIGLINIYKRIKLLYGNESFFTIESEHFSGTKITIRIPVDKDGITK